MGEQYCRSSLDIGHGTGIGGVNTMNSDSQDGGVQMAAETGATGADGAYGSISQGHLGTEGTARDHSL